VYLLKQRAQRPQSERALKLQINIIQRMKIILSLFSTFFFILTISAQSTTFGTVTDEIGEPLIFVNVLVEGTKIGTTTDVNGKYSIQNDSLNLRFSYVGYPDFVAIAPVGKLNVKMKPSFVTYTTVVIATDKRINSAHNYSLLEHKEIDLQNQSNLAPILNTSPGVFMHSGALNTNRIVIRGIGSRSPFSTNKIKAYLDDIPLTNGSGETTIEDIDLSFIKNIEIWKGPSSSRFGAGLGGTIVMNSRSTQPSSVAIHHSLGSYGLQRNTVDLHLQNQKKGRDLHINHNFTASDGYRDNTEYRRQGLTLLSRNEIEEDQLNILLNFTRLKAFIPSSLNEEDFMNEPTKAAFTWGRVKGFEDYDRLLAGISYEQKLKDNNKLNYSFFLNNRRAYELRPFNILTENSLSVGGKVAFNWVPHDRWSLRIGSEFFRESYDWGTFATNDVGSLLNPLSLNAETRLYANVFSEIIYDFEGPFKVNAGLNLNTTRYDLEDRFTPDSMDISGDYSFDPILSPRLTLSYSPRSNNDYYALVSHGFSPPSLEETLTPDGTINPDIQPETAWNVAFGTRSYFGRFNYELSIYQMWVANLLVARRTDFDQFIGINAGKTIHRGVELQTGFSFFKGDQPNKNLQLQISYNFSDFTFKEFVDDNKDYAGNELTGSPRHQLNSVLSAKFFELYGNLNLQHTGEQPLRDDNSIYSDSYTLLHGKIGYQFFLVEKWLFDFYAGVNNIFDENYASMHQINAGSFGGSAPRYYYPGLPRHFYAGVILRRDL
jgi:iron complex outermembrane receptor protein